MIDHLLNHDTSQILSLFKLISAMIILAISIIAGLWSFLPALTAKTKNIALEFPIGESIASGVFLGAGLLHMLPDANGAFNQAGYDYPFAFFIAGISFLCLLLLEHISVSLNNHQQTVYLPLLTSLMLSIHSLLEGAAIGFGDHLATMLIIFIAIIAHKGLASFALSVKLNQSKLSMTYRLTAFGLFALMTPIGILSGNWISDQMHFQSDQISIVTPVFNALAAGTFLYIGTLHGLGRASLIKHCCNMKEFFLMLTGFIGMAVVAVIL